MSLQIIQEVVELLIEKAVQEKLRTKFQTITRGQFWISLRTILWDQWGGGLYLRKGNHAPHASAVGTRSTFHNVHPCHRIRATCTRRAAEVGGLGNHVKPFGVGEERIEQPDGVEYQTDLNEVKTLGRGQGSRVLK